MDVEHLLEKLRTLLGYLGEETRAPTTSAYLALATDSLVSVLNLIRAAELTVDSGAARSTIDAMLREHMLGRMQREAAFMARLAEQPAVAMEATLQRRNPQPRKPRARARAHAPSEH